MSVAEGLAKARPKRAPTMRAAQLVEPERFEIVDVTRPDPATGQVLIKLEGCGVCASNVPPFEGREWFNYPMEPGALGHEGWGVVDALGSEVTMFREGDRVAFLGQKSYAEYDVCDASGVIKIPSDAKPFPGEPLGCAMNIFARSEIRRGHKVAIVGAGFLGSLLTHLASGADAEVIAVARKPYALQVAEDMGAKHTVPMHDHQAIISEVNELTNGCLCDVVIEATGKQWPLDLAAELTKERGRLVVAGFHQDGPRQINMFLWNWRGLDVINAHEREQRVYVDGMRRAQEAVREGRLKPEPLYTHALPLSELGRALVLTRERPEGFMKALVLMEE